jgi:tripartite-type tricarboxylate transporter receptor subunit TctC
MALWAQKDVNPAIAAKLESWVLAAGKDPEYAELLLKAGNMPISQTGQEVRERLGRERARWEVLVKAAGVQPE